MLCCYALFQSSFVIKSLNGVGTCRLTCLVCPRQGTNCLWEVWIQKLAISTGGIGLLCNFLLRRLVLLFQNNHCSDFKYQLHFLLQTTMTSIQRKQITAYSQLSINNVSMSFVQDFLCSAGFACQNSQELFLISQNPFQQLSSIWVPN